MKPALKSLGMKVAAWLLSTVLLCSAIEIFFRSFQHTPWLRALGPSTIPRQVPLAPELENALSMPRFDYLRNLKMSYEMPVTTDEDPANYSELYVCAPHNSCFENSAFRPNTVLKAHLKTMHKKNTVYSATYNIDQYGRRQTSKTPGKKNKAFLLFGCSYAFGEGLEDNETMASQFALSNPEYKAYNFGNLGRGPHTDISILNQTKPHVWHQGVTERDGVAVFQFIDDHIARATGSLDYIRRMDRTGYEPHYEVENGQLVHKGSFASSRYWLTNVYGILGASAFLQFFRIEWPPPTGNYAVTLVAEILKEEKAAIRRKYGIADFYVVLFPGAHIGREYLKPHLLERDIKVMDFSTIDLSTLLKRRNTIGDGGHPSALTNRLISDLVTVTLESERTKK